MAWLVRLPTDPRYCPLIRLTPEDRRFFVDRIPLFEPERPYRFDPAEVPKRVHLLSGDKAIPDFVAINGRLSMCPEARALVEELEPGVHQFFPVEVVRPRSKRPIHRLDGRVLDGPYYLFNVQAALDAVWVERSEVDVLYDRVDGRPRVIRRPGNWNIVLRRDVIQGHHVWRGARQLKNDMFFSDALVRAIEARRLRKLVMHHLEEA